MRICCYNRTVYNLSPCSIGIKRREGWRKEASAVPHHRNGTPAHCPMQSHESKGEAKQMADRTKHKEEAIKFRPLTARVPPKRRSYLSRSFSLQSPSVLRESMYDVSVIDYRQVHHICTYIIIQRHPKEHIHPQVQEYNSVV